jgi:predicted nuclease of predicted toxin-antitoxin system
VKVLVDMNLAPNWVTFLSGAGFAVQHWRDLGIYNAPDSEIMAYAKAEGWIVLTNDLDFSSMLAWSGDAQPTVVQIRAPDLRVEVIGDLVLSALVRLRVEAGDAGTLVTVEPERTRFRVLPFPKRS